MKEIVFWIIEPIHMTVLTWLCGIGTGYVVGRARKTRPLEIERDMARAIF